jgi:hypothetical protein
MNKNNKIISFVKKKSFFHNLNHRFIILFALKLIKVQEKTVLHFY